jgi:L-gulonolactone oxidase
MVSLVNWNDEIKFDVPNDKFKKPSSIAEVQSIVKDANAKNAKVKVIGAMHSITPCFVGSDIVLSNEKMNKILSIDTGCATAKPVCQGLFELFAKKQFKPEF